MVAEEEAVEVAAFILVAVQLIFVDIVAGLVAEQ